MKKTFIAVVLLCVCLSFGSCAAKRYSDTLTCENVTNSLKTKIFANEQYSEYLPSDISHMFDHDGITDSCVVYSSSSDDIGEFGILRAESAEAAKELLNKVNAHIDDIREEKGEFLRNYMPEELSKLENASAKQYGQYVVFALHDSDTTAKVFKEAEALLRLKS